MRYATPKVIEVNCTTGETIEREMTADELAQRETDRIAGEAFKAEQEAQATAKATLKASAILKLTTGVKLTTEEAELLVL